MPGPLLGPSLLGGLLYANKRKTRTISVDNRPDSVGPYGDLAASDPYAKYDYKMSGLEALGQSLGFRTKFDRFSEDMALQSREFQAGIEQAKFENEYNDPAAQAARMRAAGLNPDLTGTSGVEPASDMSLDDGSPVEGIPAEDREAVMSGLSCLMDVSAAALGLTSGFASLKGLHLENDMKEMNLFNSLVNGGIGLINLNGQVLPDTEQPSIDGEVVGDLSESFSDRVLAPYKSMLSKRNYKRLHSSLPALSDSIASQVAQLKQSKEYFNERGEFYGSYTDPLKNAPYESIVGNYHIINSALSDYAKQNAINLKDSSLKAAMELIYGKQYYSEMNRLKGGAKAAQADVAASEAGLVESFSNKFSSTKRTFQEYLDYNALKTFIQGANRGDPTSSLMFTMYMRERLTPNRSFGVSTPYGGFNVHQ